MRIYVCVKQVPDTSGKVAVNANGTLDRASMATITNPDDLAAVEAALRLKDETGAKVTVVSMGPPPAEGMLRECIAMGADDAVLISGREFGGSDTFATSQIIAGGLSNLGVGPEDIIFCGRQAIDGDTAQVGPQIAEHLDLPQVTYVENLEFDGSRTFTIRKSTEDGFQLVQVDAPCVVTVLATANKARYMSVRGIVEAYNKEVEVWGFEHISVEEEKLGLKGSPTRVWKSFTKGAKAAGKVFEVEPAEAADIIVEKLKEKFII